jgi:hypothetical protein
VTGSDDNHLVTCVLAHGHYHDCSE